MSQETGELTNTLKDQIKGLLLAKPDMAYREIAEVTGATLRWVEMVADTMGDNNNRGSARVDAELFQDTFQQSEAPTISTGTKDVGYDVSSEDTYDGGIIESDPQTQADKLLDIEDIASERGPLEKVIIEKGGKVKVFFGADTQDAHSYHVQVPGAGFFSMTDDQYERFGIPTGKMVRFSDDAKNKISDVPAFIIGAILDELDGYEG